jgi:hypothetical protein
MSSLTDSLFLHPGSVAAAGVGSPESSDAGSLPRSAAVGRILRRIRLAEKERRDLQRETERLLKLGRVMQQD